MELELFIIMKCMVVICVCCGTFKGHVKYFNIIVSIDNFDSESGPARLQRSFKMFDVVYLSKE